MDIKPFHNNIRKTAKRNSKPTPRRNSTRAKELTRFMQRENEDLILRKREKVKQKDKSYNSVKT
jgi:hypothetical protein